MSVVKTQIEAHPAAAGIDHHDWTRVIERQREFFRSHRTLDVAFRIEKLKLLQRVLIREEPAVFAALQADLGKSAFEAYGTELGFVLEELRYTLRHLRRWARPRRVPTPLMHFPSRSTIYPEPLGLVLIISPWNYPVQLTFTPLIAAIAAGNCAVIKPSRYVPHTSQVMERIIRECFEPEYVSFFQGSAEVNAWLLETRFDHIFFTGSTRVGRTIMAAAARHLTPVTLELGGKSPCIVDRTANIDLAARRILWGKSVCAGQTCIAPDYLLVQKEVKAELLERIRFYNHQFFGEDSLANPEYPQIVTQRHFDRLHQLLDGHEVIVGGKADRDLRKIEPTLLGGAALDDAVMKEEIFGPLLPVLEFDQPEEALALINRFEKPLSLYLFTRDKAFEEHVVRTVPFGGGCINDTLIQIANPNLPFGGVGDSGIGSYHGSFGFDTFTHYKGVVKKSDRLDIALRNPPFRDHLKFLKWFMR